MLVAYVSKYATTVVGDDYKVGSIRFLVCNNINRSFAYRYATTLMGEIIIDSVDSVYFQHHAIKLTIN